jgi:methylglyoxal synthase
MPEHQAMPAGRRIALIAHDNEKQDMLEWAEYNQDLLAGHELFATATTGHLLQQFPRP